MGKPAGSPPSNGMTLRLIRTRPRPLLTVAAAVALGFMDALKRQAFRDRSKRCQHCGDPSHRNVGLAMMNCDRIEPAFTAVWPVTAGDLDE
jgi:hypothetical protein